MPADQWNSSHRITGNQQPVDHRLAAILVGHRPVWRRPGRLHSRHQPDALRIGELQPRANLRRHARLNGRQQRRQPALPGRRQASSGFGHNRLHQHRQAGHIQFRQHRTEDARLQHQRQRRHRIGQRQQQAQFHGDPLAAQRHQIIGAGRAGRQPVGINVPRKTRGETEEAQDPQMIFGNALQRIADEAHAARRQIVKAAPIIIDHAVRQMGIKRVDGEIPPRRILAPVIGEGDLRVAARDPAGAVSACATALQGWPTAPWAPSTTLELANALNATDRKTQACTALTEFTRRYAETSSPAVRTRATEARTRIGCPAAAPAAPPARRGG